MKPPPKNYETKGDNQWPGGGRGNDMLIVLIPPLIRLAQYDLPARVNPQAPAPRRTHSPVAQQRSASAGCLHAGAPPPAADGLSPFEAVGCHQSHPTLQLPSHQSL